MFFNKLSVLAAVAFGAFTSALPLGDLPVPDLGAVTGIVSGVAGNLPVAGALGGVVPRDGVSVKGVAAILVDVQAQISPVVDILLHVGAHNATLDACQGPAHELATILLGATVDLKALVGADASVILASVDGTAQITIAELGHIVAGVVVTVFHGLGAVVAVAGATIDATLFGLLCTVGGAVATVLGLVLHVAAGVSVDVSANLIATVAPLCADVIATVKVFGSASATITALLHITA